MHPIDDEDTNPDLDPIIWEDVDQEMTVIDAMMLDPFVPEKKGIVARLFGNIVNNLGTWLIRAAIFGVTALACLIAATYVYTRFEELRTGMQVAVENADPSLDNLQARLLETYLSVNLEALNEPAGRLNEERQFVVAQGETADSIAANLANLGIVTNTELFLNYVTFYGLDSKLQAGTFTLNPQNTIPQIAEQLTDAQDQTVAVRFTEGWRFGEMVDYLRQNPSANVNANEFEAIITRQKAFDFSPYTFLQTAPDDQSLEGFLFPDTYLLPLDADATYLVTTMLETFAERVPPTLEAAFFNQDLTTYEAVTLASIIEREAVLNEERPIMAGVFLNRLRQGIKLEADPTVQYGLGYQAEAGTWWKRPLTREDLESNSPYNAYKIEGLPPSPIANPSLSSLQAVANPQATTSLFFVVDCTRPGENAHVFSETYEEHLANVERCR